MDITPIMHRFGKDQNRVVVIDGLCPDYISTQAIAEALAPFAPVRGNAYPGLRHMITPRDQQAYQYAEHLLQSIGPYIGGAYDFDSYDWMESSFSMITQRPESLSFNQKAPHYDSTNPNYIAILQYLSDTPNSGTGFYRHRATGYETLSEANLAHFMQVCAQEKQAYEDVYRSHNGYDAAHHVLFEEIGRVEAQPGRIVFYQGCLLHSGIIPETMNFSSDPRKGRLTSNLFVLGKRA